VDETEEEEVYSRANIMHAEDLEAMMLDLTELPMKDSSLSGQQVDQHDATLAGQQGGDGGWVVGGSISADNDEVDDGDGGSVGLDLRRTSSARGYSSTTNSTSSSSSSSGGSPYQPNLMNLGDLKDLMEDLDLVDLPGAQGASKHAANTVASAPLHISAAMFQDDSLTRSRGASSASQQQVQGAGGAALHPVARTAQQVSTILPIQPGSRSSMTAAMSHLQNLQQQQDPPSTSMLSNSVVSDYAWGSRAAGAAAAADISSSLSASGAVSGEDLFGVLPTIIAPSWRTDLACTEKYSTALSHIIAVDAEAYKGDVHSTLRYQGHTLSKTTEAQASSSCINQQATTDSETTDSEPDGGLPAIIPDRQYNRLPLQRAEQQVESPPHDIYNASLLLGPPRPSYRPINTTPQASFGSVLPAAAAGNDGQQVGNIDVQQHWWSS
jgi:hypothetical protein